jgi:hypothetical protein
LYFHIKIVGFRCRSEYLRINKPKQIFVNNDKKYILIVYFKFFVVHVKPLILDENEINTCYLLLNEYSEISLEAQINMLQKGEICGILDMIRLC